MSFSILNIFGESEQNPLIPARDPGALTGSGFINRHMNTSVVEREKDVLIQLMSGNLPDFLRKMDPVTVKNGNDELTYLVMPDYLAIGNDDDYVRIPMNPLTAQKIMDKFDCTMPTTKMVNQIWKQSVNKLTPLPWGPPYNADMQKTHRINTHNLRIQNQLTDKDPFALTSGHKKDVVLTNRLAPKNIMKKVAIYGWVQPTGIPIQPLNPTSHEDTYSDYSHGIRAIANDVILNSKVARMSDIFTDKKLSALISDDVPLNFLKY